MLGGAGGVALSWRHERRSPPDPGLRPLPAAWLQAASHVLFEIDREACSPNSGGCQSRRVRCDVCAVPGDDGLRRAIKHPRRHRLGGSVNLPPSTAPRRALRCRSRRRGPRSRCRGAVGSASTAPSGRVPDWEGSGALQVGGALRAAATVSLDVAGNLLSLNEIVHPIAHG